MAESDIYHSSSLTVHTKYLQVEMMSYVPREWTGPIQNSWVNVAVTLQVNSLFHFLFLTVNFVIDQ